MNRILFYVIVAILPIGMILAGFIGNYLHEQELKAKLEPPKPEPAKVEPPPSETGMMGNLFTILMAGLVIFSLVYITSRNFPAIVIMVVIAGIVISLGQSIVNNTHVTTTNNISQSDSALIKVSEQAIQSMSLITNMLPIMALAIVGGIAMFYLLTFFGRSY